MNFNMNMRKFLLTSAVAFSAASAFAAEQAEVVTQQKSLLEKLDSLNAAVLGLKINGTAKAGVRASFSSSDQYAAESPTQENQAFTDANLRLTARPSSETMIDVQLRLHKDWQSAYDENNNPVIGHWFSYDGTILNNHVDFNLGYMRVGYTPLTIFAPQTEILQEPEIFVEKRLEALEKRNLDTTSRRLMQGLNVEYRSGKVGPLDHITAQLTGARLRNTAKKLDQVFFDFDFADRYLLGARAGIRKEDGYFNVNFVNAFDRKFSRRSRAIESSDTVYYDNNRVISLDAFYDSKKDLSNLPVSFGLNTEVAFSKWKVDRDYVGKEYKTSYKTAETSVPGSTNSFVYIKANTSTTQVPVNEDYREEDGQSFYADLFLKGSVSGVDFKVDAGYFQTDSSFWSEQAATPVYQGGANILNANAIYGKATDAFGSISDVIMSTFGASSLENLYFNVYNSTTLQANNLMTSGSTNALTNDDESGYLFTRLDNNYKNGHFYRNGYTGSTVKKMEWEQDKLKDIDPSVGLALPLGLATPDRKGIFAKADVNWDDKVTFNARVNVATQTYALAGHDPTTFAPVYQENKFTEFAVGAGVDIGAIAGLNGQLLLQGSFAKGSESAYLERTTNRIVGGLTWDVWGPFALLAGYQKYEKTFGKGGFPVVDDGLAYAINLTKASESLIMGGVRIKLSPLSYVSLQYSRLTNGIDFNYVINNPALPAAGVGNISTTKNIISADVTVNF